VARFIQPKYTPIDKTREIVNTGVKNITLKYLKKSEAIKAKKLIDQKIFFSFAKEKPREDQMLNGQIYSYEKGVNRLRELVNKGKLNNREFEQKKKELLKKIY
jgi:hypothetical protein